MSSSGRVSDENRIDGAVTEELGREQEYVSMLYARLDDLREQAAERLARSLRETGGTHQDRSQRDSSITMYTDQVAQFGAVESGLCFGRLDFHGDGGRKGGDGERRYIGRIGIFDDSGDYEPLLVDWRAPAARPFYLATAASPDGVARRRHIRTERRRVVSLDDEVLDLAVAGAAKTARHRELTGEAALLAALGASRTGRMKDIVETIQVEQDRIIRAGLGGTVVVQGGPGTGKTAVALHRAAYLLYTHRAQLTRQAVLILGPNATFLRYISQVLPSLAETGVLLWTLGDLFPGVTARREEPAATAEIKGRLAMTGVLAAALRERQRVPDEPLDLALDHDTVLQLHPETVEAARERARRSGKLHNVARSTFDTEIVHALAEQLADRIGVDPYADDPLGGDDAPGDPNVLDETDRAEIRRELRREPEILAALDWLWPILTPQQLVTGLFGSADRLAVAAPDLTPAEREMLRREPRGGFSPADVPLLDEAAELLGEEDPADSGVVERRRRQQLAYAQGALDIATGSRSIDLEDEVDPELLLGTDLLDASRMAERHEQDVYLTAAQRAALDRKWAFGHVIVDEAQELSPMAWRLLMRRCPSRSMTIVGDVAQTGALGGISSWGEALDPYVPQRWRLAELTVSYRTPAEIMAVAAGVLAYVDPTLEVPRPVRETGVAPWALRAGLDRLAEIVVREVAEVGDGRIGVIVPAESVEELGRAVAEAVPDTAVGDRAELESRVVVLAVRQAKGLEFDSVLVVDPERIIAGSPRGHGDLYVALTRATQRLGVLHPGELPAPLGSLAPSAPPVAPLVAPVAS